MRRRPVDASLALGGSSSPLAGVAGSLLNPASRGPDAPYPRRGNPVSPRATSEYMTNDLRIDFRRHRFESRSMEPTRPPTPRGTHPPLHAAVLGQAPDPEDPGPKFCFLIFFETAFLGDLICMCVRLPR